MKTVLAWLAFTRTTNIYVNAFAPSLYRQRHQWNFPAFVISGNEHLENEDTENVLDLPAESFTVDEKDVRAASQPEWKPLLDALQSEQDSIAMNDPLWEQVKLEATTALGVEPEAGPQLYQGILSKRSLLEALVTIVAHEIENELLPAPLLKILFLEMLTPQDEISMHHDVMAAAKRFSGIENPMTATLFHRGLHALMCYRVGHRLWLAGRTGLAHYLQSTVSRVFSADIHPAACMGDGIYLNCGGGVVIGETAVVGQDVCILQGVTLGGTGKEVGDRHPKVGNGVIIDDGAILLGNIRIGDGAVITAKSIVTKQVPPLARMSGVPAKVTSYRTLTQEDFATDTWEEHLGTKYMAEWKLMLNQSSSM